MANVGPTELIIVLVIALLVLGPKKLPEVGRSVGKGMREFKDALAGDHDSAEPQLERGRPEATADAADPDPDPTYTEV